MKLNAKSRLQADDAALDARVGDRQLHVCRGDAAQVFEPRLHDLHHHLVERFGRMFHLARHQLRDPRVRVVIRRHPAHEHADEAADLVFR